MQPNDEILCEDDAHFLMIHNRNLGHAERVMDVS